MSRWKLLTVECRHWRRTLRITIEWAVDPVCGLGNLEGVDRLFGVDRVDRLDGRVLVVTVVESRHLKLHK